MAWRHILMSGRGHAQLLGLDDPDPVVILNAKGPSAFLLTGDHAGNIVPARLADLGIDRASLSRHIALDIGVRGLGEKLAQRLDASLICQAYSRLVIDCNRDPAHPDAMAEWSDGIHVPGNASLSSIDRTNRIAAIHQPYHAAVANMLATRREAGQPTILIALHSFTPVMDGKVRPWEIGILHGGGDTRFARQLLAILQSQPQLIVGDNAPYAMDDTDYSVPRHAFPGLLYAEIEIRQDLIGDAAGQTRLADALAGWLRLAASRIP